MSNIQPIADRILIRPYKTEESTKSGIVLPAQSQKEKDQGEIVALGSEAPDSIKVGDKVLFAKYAGEQVDWEDQKLLFVRPDDIFAVITE